MSVPELTKVVKGAPATGHVEGTAAMPRPSEKRVVELEVPKVVPVLAKVEKSIVAPLAAATALLLSEEQITKLRDEQVAGEIKSSTIETTVPRRFLVVDKIATERWLEDVGWNEHMDKCIGRTLDFEEEGEYGISLKCHRVVPGCPDNYWFPRSALKEVPRGNNVEFKDYQEKKVSDKPPTLIKVDLPKISIPEVGYLIYGFNHLTDDISLLRMIGGRSDMVNSCKDIIVKQMNSWIPEDRTITEAVLVRRVLTAAKKAESITAIYSVRGRLIEKVLPTGTEVRYPIDGREDAAAVAAVAVADDLVDVADDNGEPTEHSEPESGRTHEVSREEDIYSMFLVMVPVGQDINLDFTKVISKLSS